MDHSGVGKRHEVDRGAGGRCFVEFHGCYGDVHGRLGKQHLVCKLAKLGLGLGPQARLCQDGGYQLGGVAGLAQRGVERHGVGLTVRSKRAKKLPPFRGEQGREVFLRSVGHAIQPKRLRSGAETWRAAR